MDYLKKKDDIRYFYEIRTPKMNRHDMTAEKTKIWLPLFLSLTLILGMIFGYKLRENMGDFAPALSTSDNQMKMNELLSLINAKYVDSVSLDSLQLKTIEAMISELDPHSVYIDKNEVQELNEELDGNYQGIGVQFNMINDTVTLFSIIKNSPADLAGLQAADKIIKVDTNIVSGVGIKESRIKNLVKGKRGTSVTLLILRNNTLVKKVIKRNRIKSTNINAAFFIQPGIAYIRIEKFAGNTYEEFMQHLERLKKEGMQKLILDLRDNGGGMLDDAVQIADEFISGNKQIVSTKGYNVSEQVISARRPGLFEEGKLVLLINENSASASEVLAGALQDWNRATIIGRRSFGKGLVQEQFSLSDGSAVRLTIARYYTPVGRCIQKPYKKGIDTGYSHEVSQRMRNGEILNNHHNSHSGKAFKLQDGRVLYSDEGITPEYFIPIDSVRWLLYNQKIDIQKIITETSLQYFRNHKNDLNKLNQITDLRAYINKDPEIDNLLKQWCKSLPSAINIKKCNEIFLSDFEDMLSWMIWNEEGYYKTSSPKDPVIQKALLLMN